MGREGGERGHGVQLRIKARPTLPAPHGARAAPRAGRLQHHLFDQAHIRLNPSKTRVWNAAGSFPEGLLAPDGAQIWVGDARTERGLRVLGTPLCTPECVAAQLDTLSTQHGRLFVRLPDVPDLQVAWLLLYCAVPRAQYVLRVLPPSRTSNFASATGLSSDALPHSFVLSPRAAYVARWCALLSSAQHLPRPFSRCPCAP